MGLCNIGQIGEFFPRRGRGTGTNQAKPSSSECLIGPTCHDPAADEPFWVLRLRGSRVQGLRDSGFRLLIRIDYFRACIHEAQTYITPHSLSQALSPTYSTPKEGGRLRGQELHKSPYIPNVHFIFHPFQLILRYYLGNIPYPYKP